MRLTMISTKGRYALRVMLDLAQQDPDHYTPLDEIATRQGISKKYLEIILKVQTFITQNQFGLTSFLDYLDLIQDTLRS